MLKNLIPLKYLLLGFIILLSKICVAQNILEIFESLPDSVVLNLTVEERKLITSISKDNKNAEDAKVDLNKHKTAFAFETVDLKNAYLKLIGNFEGELQICYWNLSDKFKLVGVYKQTCGPVCNADKINFYLYDKVKGFDDWPLLSVLPLKEIELQIKDEIFKKCNSTTSTSILDNLLYQFPDKGKDFVIYYNNESSINANETCANDIKINLFLLKENLKNTTYFGIKK